MPRGHVSNKQRVLTVVALAALLGPMSARADAKTKADVSDFDGDGYADLAIAAPGETVGGVTGAGLISVLYSSKLGPTSDDSWDRASEGIEGGPHTDASLGGSLASGDFDNDGYDDLAVGAPGDTAGARKGAGTVTVIGGSESGLGGADDRLLSQNTSGIDGDPETGDHFGAALASGDFDDDGYDDLAIGAPDEQIRDKKEAGTVTVVYGSETGLRPDHSRVLTQGTDGLPGTLETDDGFGHALAAGNLDGDANDDLVIGAPGETVGNKKSSGTVVALFGTNSGLRPSYSQALTQGVSAPGTAESGDRFGEALALGDIDEDGNDDVVISAPSESVGDAVATGAITVMFGTPEDGVQTEGAQVITQATKGVPSEVESHDRFGRSTAVGDIDGDGDADVVVGAPGEGAGPIVGAGSATVLFGTHDGLSTSGVRLLYEGKNGVPGTPATDEFFGNAVRVIDTNDDGRGEVVIGAPGEKVGPDTDGGIIVYLAGTRDGVAKAGARVVSQDTTSIEGDAELGDLFGFTLG